MKRILLSALGLLALGTTALAQVNVVPQTGITLGYLAKATYSSSFFGLVPVITANTDEVCITGSATKIVRVQRVTIYGTTATAPQTLPVSILRRASADTGGTPAVTTANPGVLTQIASRDTTQATNASATAVLISYTAAPTVVDTAPVWVESQLMTMPVVTGVMSATPVDFNFEAWAEDNVQVLTLRGVAQQACVNINAALTNASAWNGTITWTEE